MPNRKMPTRRIAQPSILAIPNYGPMEAALFLHLPYDTLHYWISPDSGPVIVPAKKRPPLLSFKNVIECYVLDVLRRIHKISMPKVRFSVETLRALQEAKYLMRTNTPLADHDLRIEGKRLYVYDLHGKIVELTTGGQLEWPELVQKYLHRVVRDKEGMAQRFYPLLRRHDSLEEIEREPEYVVVDPKISFGKPVLAGTGISTEVIAGRLTAGDTESELVKEYGRTLAQIRAAAAFEGVAVTS